MIGLVFLMAVGSGGMAMAQVHGAPTTPAPPGQSTVRPPGPPGLPATTSPAANAAAANNPANMVAPGQPTPAVTNAAGVVINGNLPAEGATNAAGVPLTTGPNGVATSSYGTNNGTGSTYTGTTNGATATPTPTVQPTVTTQANAVGMPQARSPFVQPTPGQATTNPQGQATGR